MAIIRLTENDNYQYFEEIAFLHEDEIHHGVLPLLGTCFLARLYYDLARQPGCGVWVLLHENRVQGFLIGCDDLRTCFLRVILWSWFRLGLLALPKLVRPEVFRKVLSVFLYPFRMMNTRIPNTVSKGELLAIAVVKVRQGHGVGKELVQRFEDFLFFERNVYVYEVTTNSADPSSNGFYQKIGCEPTEKIQHHDLMLQRYRKCLVEPASKQAA